MDRQPVNTAPPDSAAPSVWVRVAAEARPWLTGGLVGCVLLVVAHVYSAQVGFSRESQLTLGVLLDYFRCCVLSVKGATTLAPAFLLGGALTALMPTAWVEATLGSPLRVARAYVLAAVSGVVLSLCSCNILPVFAGMYLRGAGVGPAFTFLYAGPALNLVALVLTVRYLGAPLGIARAVGVPVVALVIGVLMARLFPADPAASSESEPDPVRDTGDEAFPRRLFTFFGLLLTSVVVGAVNTTAAWQGPVVLVVLTGVSVAACRQLSRQERRDWFTSTYGLAKLVLPVLFPSVVFFALVGAGVGVDRVSGLLGVTSTQAGSVVGPVILADLFGALVYFPLLAEVAFAKVFLQLGMDPAAALTVLLTGSGLSLPGAVIAARIVGWRRVLVYELLVIALTVVFALAVRPLLG